MSGRFSSVPGPRCYTFSASGRSPAFVLGGQCCAYVWGGLRKDAESTKMVPVDDLNFLYVFRASTEAWDKLMLKGQHPPGVSHGACARIGEYLYFYGGRDKSGGYTGSLHKLNLKNLKWQAETFQDADEAPKEKLGCAMVEYNGKLVLYGGETADGDTDELHIYDFETATWSCLSISGAKPPPDCGIALTRVSQDQFVLTGGINTVDTFVLDLLKECWTKVSQSPPVGSYPTATCLGFSGDHAQLLIIGCHGVQLLDVATWKWMKIPSEKLKCYSHSTTILKATPTTVELVAFGGMRNVTNLIADTTILIFRRMPGDKMWNLILSQETMGEKKSVADKPMMVSQSGIGQSSLVRGVIGNWPPTS